MSGHVNMMDDVLISNAPLDLLRSAMRQLLAHSHDNQPVFVGHVQHRLLQKMPELTEPHTLFPEDNVVVPECKQFVALTRCLYASKLAQEALPYLAHLIRALPASGVRWSAHSPLGRLLVLFAGDIVQAIQALKESCTIRTAKKTGDVNSGAPSHLATSLTSLLETLHVCHEYCLQSKPAALQFPFSRAEYQVRDALSIYFPDHSADVYRPVNRHANNHTNGHANSHTNRNTNGHATEMKDIGLGSRAPHAIEKVALGPLHLPRLLNGLWQLSSPAWGSSTAEEQDVALGHLAALGLTMADMADHYGDAELIYGAFRNRLPHSQRSGIYAATKWCVFQDPGHAPTASWVRSAVQERSRRLGGRVDLLQFHWFDYRNKDYLIVLLELVALTKSHPELVSAIGLCNFDAEHTAEACEYLLQKTGTVGIVSNQIQFSLCDTRPLKAMCSVCKKYSLKLLTYGTFCGGFLSDRWLDQPIPEIYSETTQLTPSQRKYLDMILTWGTWDEFQLLLRTLTMVAKKHAVSVSNVATRWVLQQPAVSSVIVGTRLGVSGHGDENLAVFDFCLDVDDMHMIDIIALGPNKSKTNTLFERLGDCGHEYGSH